VLDQRVLTRGLQPFQQLLVARRRVLDRDVVAVVLPAPSRQDPVDVLADDAGHLRVGEVQIDIDERVGHDVFGHRDGGFIHALYLGVEFPEMPELRVRDSGFLASARDRHQAFAGHCSPFQQADDM